MPRFNSFSSLVRSLGGQSQFLLAFAQNLLRFRQFGLGPLHLLLCSASDKFCLLPAALGQAGLLLGTLELAFCQGDPLPSCLGVACEFVRIGFRVLGFHN